MPIYLDVDGLLRRVTCFRHQRFNAHVAWQRFHHYEPFQGG